MNMDADEQRIVAGVRELLAQAGIEADDTEILETLNEVKNEMV